MPRFTRRPYRPDTTRLNVKLRFLVLTGSSLPSPKLPLQPSSRLWLPGSRLHTITIAGHSFLRSFFPPNPPSYPLPGPPCPGLNEPGLSAHLPRGLRTCPHTSQQLLLLIVALSSTWKLPAQPPFPHLPVSVTGNRLLWHPLLSQVQTPGPTTHDGGIRSCKDQGEAERSGRKGTQLLFPGMSGSEHVLNNTCCLHKSRSLSTQFQPDNYLYDDYSLTRYSSSHQLEWQWETIFCMFS